MQERITDNERKKKELQVAVEKQRIMDCVLKHGGPVRSVQDIQAVSCSGVEALKNQLKYLKVILGKRVKVSGTKVQLEAALKAFVKGDESSIIVSPLRKRRKILEDDSSFDSSNSSSPLLLSMMMWTLLLTFSPLSAKASGWQFIMA